MRRAALLRIKLLLALALCVVCGAAAAQALPDRFEPARDAAADLATAVSLAKAHGKRVLVDVGGEWCSWCHILDRTIAADDELRALRDQHYVWLKINFSPANKNEQVLSRWPKVAGYPHLFVLDENGRLLHSQSTGALESGKAYDRQKLLQFFREHRRS
jgi:thiol:disulfide interchange protein